MIDTDEMKHLACLELLPNENCTTDDQIARWVEMNKHWLNINGINDMVFKHMSKIYSNYDLTLFLNKVQEKQVASIKFEV